MKILKLRETAKAPSRGSASAAGWDLHADLSTLEDLEKDGTLRIPRLRRKLIPTGLSIELPSGCYGRIAPRSGLALKHGIDVMAGVIDSDYRGEVHALLYNTSDEDFIINQSDRIAQLIIERIFITTIEIVESLTETARGAGGYGSTGR